MNRLQNIVAYLCVNYPYKQELSKARLTKLVYLADWFSALIDEQQLTDVHWIFNHYGPYVDDVIQAVRGQSGFSIMNQSNMYGSDKWVVAYDGDHTGIQLRDRDRQILDAVINKTKGMYFNDFIDYVYSTYPVTASDRYAHLDLVSLARDYKNNQPA